MADEGFKRKLTAILSADAVGYSRLMREDEEATVRDIAAHRILISEIIQQHHGRVIDSPGDNVLAEFASVVDAVNGAIKIQDAIKRGNTDTPKDRRMEFRIGINLGDVIEEEERIYGDGVNIAARVEGLASAGGIAISGTVYEHIKDKLSLGYHFLGEQDVKNIPEPVRIYRLLTEAEDAGKMIGEEKPKSRYFRYAAFSAFALIVLIIGALAIWNNYFRVKIEHASVEKMAFPLPEKPSIAVLPFDNMSDDPKQEFFSDGITEEIISSLSKTDQLFVIARNSTFVYKGKPVQVKQVAEELGVRYVLEGSVRKTEDRVRVTAQLIDAITGHHLWSERYDRDLKDIFALQDEITMKIVTALQVKLTEGDQARMWSKKLKNLDFLLKRMEALSLWRKGTTESYIRHGQLAQEIVDMAPEASYGYMALGWHYWYLTNAGKSPQESIAKAFKLAQKAISLDESDAFSHALLGSVYLMMRKYEKAIAAGERSIELDPNGAQVHGLLGLTLSFAGRPDEAIGYLNKGIRLNPFPAYWYYLHLGTCYRQKGQYEEALTEFKKALHLSPDNGYINMSIAAIYALLDRQEEAEAAANKVLEINPNFSVERVSKALPFKKPADLKLFVDAMTKAGLPYTPPLPLPDKPSIAVLAFDNLSGDPEQEYFADGISEEIITALSKTPKLFVIARTSSFKYKGKEVDIRTVGRELGVRYVLEGSVRKAGDKIRITAQLINAITEKHLWAERYERNLREIFAIQDEITLAIIKAMQVELTKGEMADLTGRGTKNLDAYLKALQAQEKWWRMNKQSTLKAKQLALEAIAIDGQYGYPYAIVSWSHMMDVWLQSSVSPKESMQLAVEAIQKALTLDEFDYRIHIVLSNLYVMQGKNDKAISSAERALELCPGGAFAHAVMGTALRYACRFDESVKFREQAIKLDPFPTAMGYRNLALAYSRVGRYDDAIAEYKKALHTNPNEWVVHFGMIEANAKLNRKEEARIATKELLRIRPDFSLDWLAETTVPMYAKECRSKISDDIEFLRAADVGLQ